MQTGTTRIFTVKALHLLPLLTLTSICIVNADSPLFVITPSTVNSGGGLSVSTSYSTQFSLGQLSSSSSSISYVSQSNTLAIPDTDGDGFLDNIDLDDDNDGLSDLTEINLGTNPLLFDTDGDGLNDDVDPNPLTPNADGDLAPYGSPDGIINAADLIIARQIVLGDITPSTQDIIHADLYPVGAPDGIIDVSDLLLLEQLILSPAP